jgi:hypothetical protein
MQHVSKPRFLAVFALFIALAGCTNGLQKVAQSLSVVQVSAHDLRVFVHTANTSTPQAISDNNTMAIYQICDKIDAAGIQADALTRSYTQLPPTTKPKIAALVNPIIAAIDDSIATGLVPITDPATKQRVLTILQTIKSGLVVVQSVVGA